MTKRSTTTQITHRQQYQSRPITLVTMSSPVTESKSDDRGRKRSPIKNKSRSPTKARSRSRSRSPARRPNKLTCEVAKDMEKIISTILQPLDNVSKNIIKPNHPDFVSLTDEYGDDTSKQAEGFVNFVLWGNSGDLRQFPEEIPAMKRAYSVLNKNPHPLVERGAQYLEEYLKHYFGTKIVMKAHARALARVLANCADDMEMLLHEFYHMDEETGHTDFSFVRADRDAILEVVMMHYGFPTAEADESEDKPWTNPSPPSPSYMC